MNLVLQTSALVLLVGFSPALSGQAPVGSQAKPVVQAFEHYEQVRTALAADKFADMGPHATRLAVVAEAAGGPEAKKAADGLVAAKNIEDARKHFGELSTVLVPIFQAEKIPGTTAYMCSMKDRPWVQRGDKIANPYYGKAMLTCGTVLPPKGK
ncbi:MAG: DUF3347 domain-containing protein [Acidobacteriota bacterium]|nr:DUF3347 domain-containing protein [Acidobacteriota bacterium]MDQ3418050.1 DUF3347 domain-containing protein [Acidobacteriota bacterium]